jgi:uncharacterized protein YbjT (DUF2867 family)
MEQPQDSRPFTAVVAGATGATGRWIVCELVNKPECEKVIALTRSDINPEEVFPSADKTKIPNKLVVEKVDWERIKQTNELPEAASSGVTVGFCAMGSAPCSEEADVVLPLAFGNACRKAGIDSMFLVSARGASAGSWLFIADALGRREDAFKAMNFPRLGIYRPMMMDRQEKRRSKELLGLIMPSCWVIDTRDIAKVMVEHAVKLKGGLHEVSHAAMKKFVGK